MLLIGAPTKLGPCQVRSKTERPCPNQAVMEIWGIPFCERCACEQEAYFAIGQALDAGARVGVQPRACGAYRRSWQSLGGRESNSEHREKEASGVGSRSW
jgi:hypothetical protein